MSKPRIAPAKSGPPAHKRADNAGRKSRDERWAQLLDVAAQVFFEKGYDATSLQDIAERTGILKGSIYYYIDTKEDLLVSLLKESQEKGLRSILPIVDGPGDPIQRLSGMIRCHVDYVCNDRARTAVFLHERQRLSAERRKECLGDEHVYPNLFQRVITEGQKSGQFQPRLDPHLTASFLIGSLNSLYEWYQPAARYSVATIAEHYVAVMLSGVTRVNEASAARPAKQVQSRGRESPAKRRVS
jgi:AcrR family transcriptional regulator